jgi:CheY-like chemotaxis protein
LLKGIQILLVEDNVLNQKIGKYVLLKQNASVTTASNGQEAIDLVRQNNFDVVLMDLHMPVMDGYETARMIRNDLKVNIPIIALTASISANDEGECLAAGMNATILKPFDPVLLSELILKLVPEQKK